MCTTYPRHGWGGWNSVGQSDQGWCKAYHVSVSITAAFFFFAAGRTILAVSEVKDADKFERPWFGSLGRVSKPAPTCGHDLGATSTYLPPKIPMVPLTPQPSVHPVTASGQPRHHQKAPQTDAGHLIRRPAAPRLIFGPGTLQPRNARLITAIYSPPRPPCTEADRVSLSGDWPSGRLPHFHVAFSARVVVLFAQRQGNRGARFRVVVFSRTCVCKSWVMGGPIDPFASWQQLPTAVSVRKVTN